MGAATFFSIFGFFELRLLFLVDIARFHANAVAEVTVDECEHNGAHQVRHGDIQDDSDSNAGDDHRHHEHGHVVVH